MKYISIGVAFFWALSGGSVVSAHDLMTHDLEGLWINEAGSAVELSVAEDGSLTGHYRTELGQPDADSQFALTGWAQGDVVAFSVSFTDYGSITSWSGQLSEDGDGEFIRTLWQHTRDIAEDDEAEDLWRSITAGAATFRRADPTLISHNPVPHSE
ncbi:MAG: avidin/streptavidin family protein [Litorimonas sp.]